MTAPLLPLLSLALVLPPLPGADGCGPVLAGVKPATGVLARAASMYIFHSGAGASEPYMVA